MRLICLALVPAVLQAHFAFGAPGLKEVRKPIDAPDGEWWFETWEENGDRIHSNKNWPTSGKWTVKFTNKVVIYMGGKSLISGWRAAYHQPGTTFEIDLSHDLSAPDPKTVKKGIWKVDGDVLLVCYGEPGADRPTDFTASKNSERTLWTFKRKKKE